MVHRKGFYRHATAKPMMGEAYDGYEADWQSKALAVWQFNGKLHTVQPWRFGAVAFLW